MQDKIVDGKLYVDQGIIAGCAGGGFENICAAADIIKGHYIGSDAFTFSVYPASTPIYMELVKNGVVADLMQAGTIVKTAFCGCHVSVQGIHRRTVRFLSVTLHGTSRTEKALSFRAGRLHPWLLWMHVQLRQQQQIKGSLHRQQLWMWNTPDRLIISMRRSMQTECLTVKVWLMILWKLKFGPNIKDWPKMPALPENLLLKVVSEIHDPVTTTDELIPSGETSSFRSNPLGLAEFALSRKDPAYVGRAKEVQKAQKAIEAGECPLEVLDELKEVMGKVRKTYPEAGEGNLGIGSTIFAVKPGDGSAREQAASCQKVLGGWANIACEYATKRYRSNLINWGMLPFITEEDHEKLSFQNGDYIFVPDIRRAIEEKAADIKAYVVGSELTEVHFKLGDMTDAEREIILKGCLINYYRG